MKPKAEYWWLRLLYCIVLDTMQSWTPPTIGCVRPTNHCMKWDTSSRELNSCAKKIFGNHPSSHLVRLLLSLRISSALVVWFTWEWGQSNPLGKLAWAAKHQQHDEIVRWIFVAPAVAVVALACFKTVFGNSNCTLSRGPRDPSRSRLTEILKIMTIALLLSYIGKYNSDRDMLDQTSTSLVNNHFSHSAWGRTTS